MTDNPEINTQAFLSSVIDAFSNFSGVVWTKNIWCVLELKLRFLDVVWTENIWCVFETKTPFSNFSGVVWTEPELTFLKADWIVLRHQTLAMYLLAWRTRGLQTERFLLLRITTTTWHLGMEGWITAGHGACDIVTIDSGCRLICRKSTEWKVLVLKADRMQISGSRAILCRMAWTVWILLITKRMEELR